MVGQTFRRKGSFHKRFFIVRNYIGYYRGSLGYDAGLVEYYNTGFVSCFQSLAASDKYAF